MQTNNGLPRRNRLDLISPAEQSIDNATRTVEALGADLLLTDAVVLLREAQHKVADYIDLQFNKQEE